MVPLLHTGVLEFKWRNVLEQQCCWRKNLGNSLEAVIAAASKYKRAIKERYPLIINSEQLQKAEPLNLHWHHSASLLISASCWEEKEGREEGRQKTKQQQKFEDKIGSVSLFKVSSREWQEVVLSCYVKPFPLFSINIISSIYSEVGKN